MTSTRERILDVALELFAAEGVAGTTITEIERQAGLAAGSGSLYRHFRSKDEVLDAAIAREVERLLSQLALQRVVLPDAADPAERLRAEYRQVLSIIRAFDRLFRILQRDGGRARGVRTTITEAFSDGASPDGTQDRDQIAFVVSSLLGHHLLAQFHGGPFLGIDDEAFIDILVRRTPAGEPAG